MKHKYTIARETASRRLVIKEHAELDKETFSLLCEERYPEETIRTALAEGAEALIAAFRTRNFYPTRTFATLIARAIVTLFERDGGEPVEVVIDDAEFLNRRRTEPTLQSDSEDEKEEGIDELLEDAEEEEFEDLDIEKIDSGIKIAEDDPGEIEEEA